MLRSTRRAKLMTAITLTAGVAAFATGSAQAGTGDQAVLQMHGSYLLVNDAGRVVDRIVDGTLTGADATVTERDGRATITSASWTFAGTQGQFDVNPNFSFGAVTVAKKVNGAQSRGTVVVVAAGNSATPTFDCSGWLGGFSIVCP